MKRPSSCRPSPAQRELQEDTPISTHSRNPDFAQITAERYSRRDILRGGAGAIALGMLATTSLKPLDAQAATPKGFSFDFPPLKHGVDATHHVADGYRADILIRWGDKLLPGAPDFDPNTPSAAAQAMQFGYNNDFTGYLPLPLGSNNSSHGLLCVNHEYTNEEVMFPKGTPDDTRTETEMAAHGHSVVEVERGDSGLWRVVPDSTYARRLSANTTMRISGPAAGHPRLKTADDPTGTYVLGTLNNCAGGVTPWGTVLIAEENINYYFGGAPDTAHPEATNHDRMGIPGKGYDWYKTHKRFDIGLTPNEPNRFGWVVELDPYAPDSMPVKRTALGRFKHEGADNIVNKDGRVVVYCGDDQQFEYLYRFVTAGTYNPDDRKANMQLLDSGTLSAAQFHADGTLTWHPLVWGHGPLTAENGFKSQADVVIEARRAADLMLATPLDRPEDVGPNPKTGKVYVMLTNNSKRTDVQTDAVNSRAANLWGQIVELTAPDGDHAANTFRWDILVRCGNPADPATHAQWGADTGANGWFACPDNCAIDPEGRLWVCTDQGDHWHKTSGSADGVWAVETAGAARGTARMFFRVPVGAEMCGPTFTPDGETLFVAVQHAATDGTTDYAPFGRASTFADPATRWPDFRPGMPPRPSVVAITRKGGGKIA
ncbi:MAG: DUF839 domain-containing protein [Proteobacteria bacterium]|nr:DUF839 domain-containing protein [Pseudomonadota bacterium]